MGSGGDIEMKKYKCSCGLEIYSDNHPEVCYDDMVGENHTIKEVKNLNHDDYAEMWGMELESANRHSLTEMPGIICSSLIKHIGDRKIVTKIMKDLYNIGVGI